MRLLLLQLRKIRFPEFFCWLCSRPLHFCRPQLHAEDLARNRLWHIDKLQPPYPLVRCQNFAAMLEDGEHDLARRLSAACNVMDAQTLAFQARFLRNVSLDELPINMPNDLAANPAENGEPFLMRARYCCRVCKAPMQELP